MALNGAVKQFDMFRKGDWFFLSFIFAVTKLLSCCYNSNEINCLLKVTPTILFCFSHHAVLFFLTSLIAHAFYF